MGSKFKDVCYPSLSDARGAACSNFGGSSLVGADLFTAECVTTEYTARAMSICKRMNGGACETITQAWPNTPDCTHDGGVSLSYDYFLAGITLLAIVWGGKKLIQLFDFHHAES